MERGTPSLERPTIFHMAEEAGVSITTVSHASRLVLERGEFQPLVPVHSR
jgi:hypothetical protein